MRAAAPPAAPAGSWAGIEMGTPAQSSTARRTSVGSASGSLSERHSRRGSLLEDFRQMTDAANSRAAALPGSQGWRRSVRFLVKLLVGGTNMALKISALAIYWDAQEFKIFGVQLATQLTEIILSVVITFKDVDVRRLLVGTPALLRPLVFLACLVGLGLLQFIHVKRAWARQLHVAQLIASLKDQDFLWTGPALGAEPAVPIALITGVPSAVLSTYSYVVMDHTNAQTLGLIGASLSSVIVVALAVVEVDAAVSAYVAKRWHLDPTQRGSKAGSLQFLYPLFHVLYRVAEVSLRVTAMALLLAFTRFWWEDHFTGKVLAVAYVLLEYLFGVVVCSRISTRGETQLVHMAVGIALLLANAAFFVDMPGFCYPAQRVSWLLECWRFLGFCLFGVLVVWELQEGYAHQDKRWDDFESKRWKTGITVLGSACALYYTLRLSPIFRKKGDDLHSAVIRGKREKLRKLLLHGAGGVALDVNGPMKDNAEATPAMLAALRGNAEALHMLIASGARVDACDARGDTCLHYAIRGRCEECLDALASCPGARGLLQPEARGGRAEELQALARSLSEGASPEPGEVQRQLAALLARRHRGGAAHKGTMSVKPTAVSGNYLGELFPDAVTEEVPPLRELRSVSGLVVAHSTGPLARLVLPTAGACAEGGRQLELLRRTRVLGQGTFGKVIEVEVVHGGGQRSSLSHLVPEALSPSRRRLSRATSLFGQERRFAMKLQKKADGEDTEWRVCSEALALQRVPHPFIVRLVHAFQTPQCFALLLELCDGGDLNRLLCTPDAEGQCLGLELGSAARYSGQVLLALAHLHEAHHVVYRDMKPENVLLHLDSDSAKLADFGSAKFVGGRKRRRMSLVGTQGFLAPELIIGGDDSDGEESGTEGSDALDPFLTDSYSFGVTLGLMLLGEDMGILTTDENDGEFMLPRAGSEEDRMADLEQALLAGRIAPEAKDLLTSLLRHRPKQRSQLADPRVLEHPFFLGALRCQSMADHLLPPASP